MNVNAIEEKNNEDKNGEDKSKKDVKSWLGYWSKKVVNVIIT